MSSGTLIDDLEVDHGTAILSELTGLHLTRNQQPVRLLDQTRHTAEYYFRSDARTGKPYIQDFQNGKRYYPVTAYCEVHQVDYATALSDLSRQYGIEKSPGHWQPRTRPVRKPVAPSRPVDHLPVDEYERCRTRFVRNGLYEYLRFTYGKARADAAFDRYRLGTSRRWQYYGYLATALPQFDISGNLRQVKIIPFDAMSGRRVKKHQQAHQWNARSGAHEPTAADSDKTFFAGRQIAKDAGITDAHLQQCFFGEHLLAERPDVSVALVEAESTAIICSIERDKFVWLATGGSHGARWTDAETFGVLHGRDLVLWPDNDVYVDWSEKAKPLRKLVRSLKVSDYVKNNVPAGMEKADLRDLLTLPRYAPKAGPVILGELLPDVPSDDYPSDWDEPTPPGTVPTLRAISPADYLNQP